MAEKPQELHCNKNTIVPGGTTMFRFVEIWYNHHKKWTGKKISQSFSWRGDTLCKQKNPSNGWRTALAAPFALLAVLLQVIWIVGFAIQLTQYYAYISTAVSILALMIAMRIYGEHINSAYKFSWIIVIMAFPILGLCLFLLFGREGASLLMKKRLYAVDQKLKQYHPSNEAVLSKLQARQFSNRQSGLLHPA